MSSDRHQLADAYDAQREIVVDVYSYHGAGRIHALELARLAELAAELHAAERAAGLPIGATRRDDTRRDDTRHEQAA